MRTVDDYEKLIQGYNFNMSVLKKARPDIYDIMKSVIYTLNKHGARFSDMVRELKIDFVNENDTRGKTSVKMFKKHKGITVETFGLGYLPLNGYSLTLYYSKQLGIKIEHYICEIFTNTIEDIIAEDFLPSFRIIHLDANQDAKKVIAYISAFTEEGTLEIVKQDLDKPKDAKIVCSIPVENLNDEIVDESSLF